MSVICLKLEKVEEVWGKGESRAEAVVGWFAEKG